MKPFIQSALAAVLLFVAVSPTHAAPSQAATAQIPQLSPFEKYNFVASNQSIGVGYQFTDEPVLVETARAMLAKGSNIAKLSLEGKSPYKSLVERATQDRDVQTVFHIPFAHYFLWGGTARAVG